MALAIFTILALILSVILHEVAHGYAAYLLGDPTAKMAGRLTLNPVSHIDPVGSILIPGFLVLTHAGILFGWAKPVPYNPYNLKDQRWGEAIVGSAGVLTNLFLALLFALIARISYAYGIPTFGDLASTVCFVNLFLGMFNLVPFPPLDGFTVLRGLLPFKYALTLREFEEKLQRGGIITLLIVLFLFSQFLSEPLFHFVNMIFNFLVG